MFFYFDGRLIELALPSAGAEMLSCELLSNHCCQVLPGNPASAFSSGSQLPQSGIGIPASGAVVPLLDTGLGLQLASEAGQLAREAGLGATETGHWPWQ